jgi:peptidyl-prolyl cis-trans isomerase A (cyclophilin A)
MGPPQDDRAQGRDLQLSLSISAHFRIGRRRLLAGGGVLMLAPQAAWSADDRPRVALKTALGMIVLELRADRAPVTTSNFLHYVEAGHYDGASFYRAAKAPGAATLGLIEGGLQNDPARLFAPIVHESTAATGLSHIDGTISMAREAPGTATADFFICSGPSSYLDAHPGAPGDNAGYAAFGQVVQGMDVVRAILARPTSEQARNPVMRGQMLDPPVAIVSARTGTPPTARSTSADRA